MGSVHYYEQLLSIRNSLLVFNGLLLLHFTTDVSLAFDESILTQSADIIVENPIRNTIYGKVKGFVATDGLVQAEVFHSVPFAKPPLGPLRFKSPEAPDPWTDVYDSTVEPPWCVQFWYQEPRIEARNQKEDCLYINIFVPKNISKPSAPYPVLVWIHGGSYQVNGANMFPVEGTTRNLVAHGLVVVTVNYRLGPLGFLSTLNPDLPGNFGLEDQIAALEFIRDNIKYFDGDPKRITLGGESAGASSVSLLSISPRAKDLVHGAVIRSGSAVSPWAVRSANTDLNSQLIINWSGCGKDIRNMKAVLACLQNVDVQDIKNMWQVIGNQDLMYIVTAKAQPPQNFNHPFLAHTYFTPVVDSFRGNQSVIPAYPEELMAKNAHIPVMIGVTTAECASYITWLYFLGSHGGLNIDLQDLEFVVPHVNYANSEQVKQAVSHQYVWHGQGRPPTNYAKTLVTIASDQNFVAPATLEADLYSKQGMPVYAYIYDHGTEELDSKHAQFGVYDVGSAHGYDMVMLFQSTSVLDPTGSALNWTKADLYVTQFISKTMANFIKTGDPSVSDLPSYWPKYRSDCGQAMKICPSPELIPFFPEMKTFWRQTIPAIEALNMNNGYTFYNPVTCVESCSLGYKIGFFICLALLTLLLVGTCAVAAVKFSRKYKGENYALGESMSSTSNTPMISSSVTNTT